MQIEFPDADLRTQRVEFSKRCANQGRISGTLLNAQTCVTRITTETQAREQPAERIEALPPKNPPLFHRKQARDDIIRARQA